MFKTRRFVLMLTVVFMGVFISIMVVTAFAFAQPVHLIPQNDLQEESLIEQLPILFPPGESPWYAQDEIFVKPEAPNPGSPLEICAEVVNMDPVEPHPAGLHFGVAPLGIGVPYELIGIAEVVVPPGGNAFGCVGWIPPAEGSWGIEVLLWQEGAEEPFRSLKNIDLWEPLLPGEPHEQVFPIGPLPAEGTITFTLSNLMAGWEVSIIPDEIHSFTPYEELTFTLRVIPPPDSPLGSRLPVVDVEGFLNGESIGGIRKMDNPPVPLHRPGEPFFAESEIHVWPYPPRAGEPTQICVELFNLSDEPVPVEVLFNWANFGIGLPFTPINGPIPEVVPPGGNTVVCINWVPPQGGHFCIQVEMIIPGPIPYHHQFSQRNLDVAEPLKPGIPHMMEFMVGNVPNEFTNPEPGETDIWLESELLIPGWQVEISPTILINMGPDDIRPVMMTVTAPAEGPLPPDNTPILDVRALVDGPGEPRVIGGFRKVFRPPIPLHPFPDPPYAEREITVHPYPALAGEPTEVCVELRNPTGLPQDVVVHFAWANFGIGIPFTPINGPRVVHLPPYSIVNECIHWIPPVSGKVCLEVTLEMDGYDIQRSQRNIDVDEPLEPGIPHHMVFEVRNPLEDRVTVTLGIVPHLDGWNIELFPDVLPGMEFDEYREVELIVEPPAGIPLPPDDTVIVDVEAFAEGELIGGFRKIHRPPIPLHPFPDPPYAEREITVHPYPALAGEPTEVCVELRNPTALPQDVVVHFAWAEFGIGIPFTPINGPRVVHLPPYSIVNECIHWIPPVSGKVCLEVTLEMDGYDVQRSQRNIDVDEPLEPGVPHHMVFEVRNPMEDRVTVTLGIVPHLDGWNIELFPDVLPGMEFDEYREVELIVEPPAGIPLPPDDTVIVDVEAFAEGELIGGFRKVFRPPVPIHQPKDPIYAESEIFIHPYPPRAREPTEIGVEIRNPTEEPQEVFVTFSYANFGIGLPFTPIEGPIPVILPPLGSVVEAIMWIPPEEGLWCIQVDIEIPGFEESFYSQRNIDVGEPLEPLVPHSRTFLVGNPTVYTATITLGMVPHFPDWGLELDPDTLLDVGPGEEREVTLTVTPPQDLPGDGDPIVDVEAFIEGQLIGGFRKIFRPPVPVHRPKDPIYAESEIGVDPYPVIPGVPTELSVEVFNPTDKDRIVTATFSIAPFGIGLPFNTSHITPNPIRIFVPAYGAARGHVVWTPPMWQGKFCVKVTLEMAGHEPVWSQRNIDVGEPLRPGIPHSLEFPVGIGEQTGPMTVTLGMIKHQEGWDISLSDDLLTNIQYGDKVTVTLTVTPPVDGPPLGSGEPVVDVEAYIEGELLGGFRKMDIPPIPIHKPHEKGYAESEIIIDPYPPQQGENTTVSTIVQNTSDEAMTIDLEFGWAQFGMGIPFTTTGMTPYTRSVTLNPEMSTMVSVDWVPEFSDHHCIIIYLTDPEGVYEPQRSQRNVDVVERPPCGETEIYTFTVYNNSPFVATVDLGMITFNVPADWQVTTVPSDTLVLGPFSEGTVEVHVTIPCPSSASSALQLAMISDLQAQSGSVPIVDVEGYIEGELVGGIELRFPQIPEPEVYLIYMPLIMR